MNRLKEYKDYAFIKTPVVCLERYANNKNLFLKLEGENLNHNIKSRTAYFMFEDIVNNRNVKNIVESSSGNLGLSLGYFANELGYRFLCLIDITVPESKIKALKKYNIPYESVALGNFPDYRSARIAYAKALAQRGDWFWTNQYANPYNVKAHYTTTGAELFDQMHGEIDYFVCAVGSGGTIVGVSKYIKERIDRTTVVAVEPMGSTIFGGEPSRYITAGSGLNYPSELLTKGMSLIDYYIKIDDAEAIQACLDVRKTEGLSVGITAGSVLAIACRLSDAYPKKKIVCIAADGGQMYQNVLDAYVPDDKMRELVLCKLKGAEDEPSRNYF